MRVRSTGGQVYQLKVTLRGTKPPIWRRFLVPADVTLKRLHDCLQMVMGWSDSHLHQFEVRGVVYGTPDSDSLAQIRSQNTAKVTQLLRRPKDRLLYTYDFGDGWEHEVVLEKVLPSGEAPYFPIVLAGRRACPPEDVGGVHGYYRLLEVLSDPKHPEYAEMLEWVDGPVDPEKYDVREANLAIHGGWVIE
jgi:hypothetical protein